VTGRPRVRVGNAGSRRGWIWKAPIALALWALFAAPVLAGIAGVAVLRAWAADLPAVPDLAGWRAAAPRTSRIRAADGTVLAELPFRAGAEIGHRDLVRADELPLVLVQAVLAAEDVRFLGHRGVDAQAVLRAAWINYRAGRVVEGASTITQQVARNLLPEEIGRATSLRRKVREALLARRIEARWSKRDILEVYVNFVFLGANAYGVRAAARAYFDRDLAALTAEQAATLAGLIQAPGRLDPYLAPEPARRRRDEVLVRMGRAGFLDGGALTAALAEPLTLTRPRRAYGRIAPWYTEHVRRLADLGAGVDIDTPALPALAAAIDADARRHTDRLARGGPAPEVAVLAWDLRTGYVEAMVGGRTWTDSQFDRVTQACRQPGSAWKPIVYAAALERGAITPGTALRDAPIAEYDEVADVHWKPRSGSSFRGVVLAQDALALSLNAPAIDVLDRVGASAVIQLARRLGIASDVADVRPMALGASCTRPIELARAFAVLARQGWAVAPRVVVRVRAGDEVVADDAAPEDPWLAPDRRLDRLAAMTGREPDERVAESWRPGDAVTGSPLLDPRVAYQVDDMLAAVVERGTATAARRGRPAAGKTGTTNDNTDAWFIGFTARELAAVWIGHDDPARRLGPRDDGAHAALPLWMRVIDAAEGSRPARPAVGPPPQGLERARIDRETGLLAAPGAGGGLDLWFATGTAPTEVAGRAPSSDFGRAASEF
jgi:penicillin-binding protein 1A